MGCRVDVLDGPQAVARIVELAKSDAAHAVVVTLGTEMIMRAQDDARFRDVVNASALSLCDTIGVLLAARLQGVVIRERVAGIDLIDALCAAFAREKLAVYLLGAKGDTASRAADVLRRRYPELLINGARDGYFPAAQDELVAAEIARSGAQILLAGLGSPRQEIWLAERLKESGCAVGIGVGGSFDVLAGNVARAPSLWRTFNLEWLYRLVQEPQRWRRQLALPRFVWQALRERVTSRSSRRFS